MKVVILHIFISPIIFFAKSNMTFETDCVLFVNFFSLLLNIWLWRYEKFTRHIILLSCNKYIDKIIFREGCKCYRKSIQRILVHSIILLFQQKAIFSCYNSKLILIWSPKQFSNCCFPSPACPISSIPNISCLAWLKNNNNKSMRMIWLLNLKFNISE